MGYLKDVISKVDYVLGSIKEIRTNGKKWRGGVTQYADLFWCMIRYGASPRNYYWFGFYELDASHRKTFVTHRLSQRMQHVNNDPEFEIYFDNKKLLCEKFKDFMKRKCVFNRECTEEVVSGFGDKIIYKPIAGSMAQGIIVIKTEEYTNERLAAYLQSLPDGLVEEWIVQHALMEKFNPKAVNIVRVVTARNQEKFACLAATLAVANEKEVTNASANAMFANIDIRTGEVISDACDYEEKLYTVHPKTGVKFKGFVIPFWDDVLKLVEKASAVVPEVGYVGWDIAITPNGPVIVEGNNCPGYEWMQVRMINPEGYGKKSIYGQFM